MDFNSWPSSSSSSAFKRRRGHHTDPIIYPMEVNTLDWRRRSLKRSAEDSIERPSKRSRCSDSPSNTATNASAPVNPHNTEQRLILTAQRRGHLNVGLFRRAQSGFSEWRKSGLKRSSEEPLEGPSKRSRQSHSPSKDDQTTVPSCSSIKIPHNDDKKRITPRVVENNHKKRSRKRCDVEKTLKKSEDDALQESLCLFFQEEETQTKIQQQELQKRPIVEFRQRVHGEKKQKSLWELDMKLRERERQRKSVKKERPNRAEKKEKPKKLEEKERPKRVEEREKPKKRSKKTNRHCEDLKPEPSAVETPGPSPPQAPRCWKTKAAFDRKYVQAHVIGEGGFGRVHFGYRKSDNKEVAIKYVSKANASFTKMDINGRIEKVPTEVALLLRLRQPGQTSAAVSLLDWFELGKEIILILEYINSTMDLKAYLHSKGGILPEKEAKAIMKQIVDAFLEFHEKGVFHRDIKPENILIEPCDPVPRIWIIDFGCGEFLAPVFNDDIGTEFYKTPQMVRGLFYQAQPTTVWQIGILAYELLHKYTPFADGRAIVYDQPKTGDNISPSGKDFINNCLNKDEDKRPTLMLLKNHRWLRR